MSDNKKTFESSTLKMFAQALESRGEDEVRRSLQAAIEGRPQGQSSLDEKIEYEFGGFCFTERQMREDRLQVRRPGGSIQLLRRHRNGGGFVPYVQSSENVLMAYVGDSVYVEFHAMVLDTARVTGHVRIKDNAEVSGSAIVQDFVTLSGRSRVSDTSVVRDRVSLAGSASVSGHSVVSGLTSLTQKHVYNRVVPRP